MNASRRISARVWTPVARLYKARHPEWSVEEAFDAAESLIRALWYSDLEIVHKDWLEGQPKVTLDAVDVMAEMFEQEMGRKPWLPE